MRTHPLPPHHYPLSLRNAPTGGEVSWFGDVKVYANHVYIVGEIRDAGMQVFDLTNVRSIPRDRDGPVRMEPTYVYTEFGNAHNIAINEETGFAYVVGSNTCNSGIHILDLSNPSLPTFVGCWGEDGYVHDLQVVVYNGPDTAYVGREIAFCYDEDSIAVVDITDKLNPVMISDTTYDLQAYTHQGWLTDDHGYLLSNDEMDERAFEYEEDADQRSRTLVWDVRSLSHPIHVKDYHSPVVSVDHNLFIKGKLAYMSNYSSGLRVVDIEHVQTSEHAMHEVAFLDCYPSHDHVLFTGTWSNYPYLPSGNVILSGGFEGIIMARVASGLDQLPTVMPTSLPTNLPTHVPTHTPTQLPTDIPTMVPTATPTLLPTLMPTQVPTDIPTNIPTMLPTVAPTLLPTTMPTHTPSTAPTHTPSTNPTELPTVSPTMVPTMIPSQTPTAVPTQKATWIPTHTPSETPTIIPTPIPTQVPSSLPTANPTPATQVPTQLPTITPTQLPTLFPTNVPTYAPMGTPSETPTRAPSSTPTMLPTTDIGGTRSGALKVHLDIRILGIGWLLFVVFNPSHI